MASDYSIQNVKTPYLTLLEQADGDIDNPDAGSQRIFIDSADNMPKVKDSSGAVSNLGGESSLTTDSTNLTGSDVTLTAGSWTDVVSVSLEAGTWLVWAALQVSSGAEQTIGARIYDGSTTYASAAQTIGIAGYSGNIHLVSEPIVLGSTTTIKLQGHTQAATTAATAKYLGPASEPKATYLRALKVG